MNEWSLSIIKDYLYKYCDFTDFSEEIQNDIKVYVNNLKEKNND